MRDLYIFSGIVTLLFLLQLGCRPEWEEHYDTTPETVDRNMWEDITADPELSRFVSFMESMELDTLMGRNQSFTLFVPTNDAFDSFLEEDSVTLRVLEYHISTHVMQSVSLSGTDKIQMLAEKFVRVGRTSEGFTFDGIPVERESPLYRNGKFFVLEEVARPRPNLFEYFEVANPILRDYILEQDSIIVDKEKSQALGYDEDGNTIYDTVAIVYNEFEEDYFPVREEFRYKTATIVFPSEEVYHGALNEMASLFPGYYTDYRDIPLKWQNEILIPHLLEQGVFQNSLDETDFIFTGPIGDTLKLKNILGDSVAIDYEVTEKAVCSNGVAFNYRDFSIPDTFLTGTVKHEAEWWIAEEGLNKFSWDPEYASATSDISFAPFQEYVSSASNDSIGRVLFSAGYEGSYSLEIKFDNLLPRKYLMVVRTLMSIGGVFNIYFNGELVKTVDYFDYILQPAFYYSVTGKRYRPEKGYNYWDAWAENESDYGEAVLTIEYVEPGRIGSQGLYIDYIEFIPYNE